MFMVRMSEVHRRLPRRSANSSLAESPYVAARAPNRSRSARTASLQPGAFAGQTVFSAEPTSGDAARRNTACPDSRTA